MPKPRQPTQYQTLMRKCRPRKAARKSVEEQLDGLLNAQQQRRDGGEPSGEATASALDRLRSQMRDELLPVFDDLRVKYGSAGIIMEIDAADFLAGGVQLAIEVQYDTCGMRLDGTATPAGIAFHEARFSNNVSGVVTTGPMLRTRNLCGQTFREFICERIGQLVRSATRSREGEES